MHTMTEFYKYFKSRDIPSMSIVVINFIIDPNDSLGPGHKDKNNVTDARNIVCTSRNISKPIDQLIEGLSAKIC